MPDGLYSEEDPTKDYVAIDADGSTGSQLYANTLGFIRKNIRKREKAIVDKTENEYLEFEMYKRDAIAIDTGRPVAMVTIGGSNNPSGIRNTASGTTVRASYDVKFKVQVLFFDGQAQISFRDVKFTPVGLLIANLQFKGEDWKTYAVYDKEGKLTDPDLKQKLERYFNNVLLEMSDAMVGATE